MPTPEEGRPGQESSLSWKKCLYPEMGAHGHFMLEAQRGKASQEVLWRHLATG
jgi:hypothetical protein